MPALHKMKQNAITILALFSIASFSSCGQTIQNEKTDLVPRLNLVDNITKKPTILEKKWGALKETFQKCKRNPDNIALECEEVEGIREVLLTEGPTGSSTIEFTTPTTCEEIYQVASKNLGRGKIHGNYCDAEWDLSRIKKGLSATLYTSRKNPSRIFFLIGFEQGP